MSDPRKDLPERARAAWHVLEQAEYEMQKRHFQNLGEDWRAEDVELDFREFLSRRVQDMADSIMERFRREGIL